MLKNRIIPCLDVKNGRVVKGINFVDLKDAGDPVEQAKIYSDGGRDIFQSHPDSLRARAIFNVRAFRRVLGEFFDETHHALQILHHRVLGF